MTDWYIPEPCGHDISFCWKKDCTWLNCGRHLVNAPHDRPFSLSDFDCSSYHGQIAFDNLKGVELQVHGATVTEERG